MKRKVFISINLPERTKKRLIKTIEKWQDLPVKWVKENNLHITLLFLGFVDEESMVEVCEKVAKITEETEIFDIEFDEINFGPTENDPKMIWVGGKNNENLRRLVEKIEKSLEIFSSAKKEFRPHITLGKIRQKKWQTLAKKPQIKANFSLLVTTESVDIMASDFEGDENEYALIESCQLK